MVTHTFTNGSVADADEVNQNFIDVEEADGFVFMDESNITASGTGINEFILSKTYTINKDIDGLYVWFTASEGGGGNGRIRFEKNNTTISNYIPLSTSDNSYFSGQTYNTTGGPYGIGSIYINESFTIGDTLNISLNASGDNSVTSSKRLLRGIKNKSTDTTWVSVS